MVEAQRPQYQPFGRTWPHPLASPMCFVKPNASFIHYFISCRAVVCYAIVVITVTVQFREPGRQRGRAVRAISCIRVAGTNKMFCIRCDALVVARVRGRMRTAHMMRMLLSARADCKGGVHVVFRAAGNNWWKRAVTTCGRGGRGCNDTMHSDLICLGMRAAALMQWHRLSTSWSRPTRKQQPWRRSRQCSK